MSARMVENEEFEDIMEVEEAEESGGAGVLVTGIVGGFLACAMIGGVRRLQGFVGAKLAKHEAAGRTKVEVVDAEYTEVVAGDSDEEDSEKQLGKRFAKERVPKTKYSPFFHFQEGKNMNGLLVVGDIIPGNIATQGTIVGAMYGKKVAKRQNWRECQEVLFESRKSTDDVLDNLCWVISKYGHATLADFYNLAGMRALYEGCKLGWTSLRGIKIVCTRNRYVIELPRVTSLEQRGGDTMAGYPNDSHSARERSDVAVVGETEKKLNRMATEAAKTKRKSETRRFLSIFASDDAENIKSFILSDVVIPGVKAVTADVISIALFEDTGHIGSRRSGGSKVAYQKYYDGRWSNRREHERPGAAIGFEYGDIILETRGNTGLMLDRLESAIAKYEVASVVDLYGLADVTCRNYTANRYGWSDIQSAEVIRMSKGYVIQFPQTVQIG